MALPDLNVAANRKATNYTPTEKAKRVLWSLALPLFRCTPRPCFGVRAQILRLFGATIGENVHVYNSATIYYPWNLTVGDDSAIGEHALIYNLGPVAIGRKVTISQRTHLCAGTHDFTDPAMPLLKPPIRVRSQAWICADAFVGPNVTVGEGAIVGARAVVTRDVEAWTIVAGNPARFIRKRELQAS